MWVTIRGEMCWLARGGAKLRNLGRAAKVAYKRSSFENEQPRSFPGRGILKRPRVRPIVARKAKQRQSLAASEKTVFWWALLNFRQRERRWWCDSANLYADSLIRCRVAAFRGMRRRTTVGRKWQVLADTGLETSTSQSRVALRCKGHRTQQVVSNK